MLLQLAFGFVVLVAASYVGTTMALRGFFGREYYDPSGRGQSGDPPGDDGASRTDDVPRANDVARDGTDRGRDRSDQQ